MDLFAELDLDDSHDITKIEFGRALRRIGFVDATDSEVDETWSHLDVDGNGRLELSELEDIDVQITHPTCGYGEGIITVTTKEGLSRHLKVNTKEATDACQKIQMAHEEAELRMTQIQISGAPGQAF